MQYTTLTLEDIFNIPFPYDDAAMRYNYAHDIERPTTLKLLSIEHTAISYPCEESFINIFAPYAQSPHSTQIARAFYDAYCLHHFIPTTAYIENQLADINFASE